MQNQIYTFMTCSITVMESSALPLTITAAAAVPLDPTLFCSTSSSTTNFLPAEDYSEGSGMVSQFSACNPVIDRGDRRFRAPKLHGSFSSGGMMCRNLQAEMNTTYRNHFEKERDSVTSPAAIAMDVDTVRVQESLLGVAVMLPVDYIPPVGVEGGGRGDHSAESLSPYYPPLPSSRMRPPTSTSSSNAITVPSNGTGRDDLICILPPAAINGASHPATSHPLPHPTNCPFKSVKNPLHEIEAERKACGKRSPTYSSQSIPTYSTITTTTVCTSTSPSVPHTVPNSHKKSAYLIRSNDMVIGSISKSVQDLILAELCGDLLDIPVQDPSQGEREQGVNVPSQRSQQSLAEQTSALPVPARSQCNPLRLAGSFGLTTSSQRSSTVPTDEMKNRAMGREVLPCQNILRGVDSDVSADINTSDGVFPRSASSNMMSNESANIQLSKTSTHYDASMRTSLLSDCRAEGHDGDEDGGGGDADCEGLNESAQLESGKQRRSKKKNQKKNLKKKSKTLDSCLTEEFVDLESGGAYTDISSACHPHTDIMCGDVGLVSGRESLLSSSVMEDKMDAEQSNSSSSEGSEDDKQARGVGDGEGRKDGEEEKEEDGGSEGASHGIAVTADMTKSTQVEVECEDVGNRQSLIDSDSTTAPISSLQSKVPLKRK